MSTIRPILMQHAPDSHEHLDRVREEMRRRGRPKLDAINFGHTIVIPDGVHRIFAAYQLDLKPQFLLHHPWDLLHSAPRYLKKMKANLRAKGTPMTEEQVGEVSNLSWLFWLRLNTALMHATLGEVLGIFAVDHTGRLRLVKEMVSAGKTFPVQFAATDNLYRDLTSPQWLADTPAHKVAEVRVAALQKFNKPMERAEWERMTSRAA
jgi:hypothetical protein